MANIILKKSSVAAKEPLTTDLEYGELALNYNDGKLFFKNSSNVIKEFVRSDIDINLLGKEVRLYGPSDETTEPFGDLRINPSDTTGDLFIQQNVGDFISIRDSANDVVFSIYTNHATTPGLLICTNTLRPEFSSTVADLGTSSQRFQDIYLQNSPNVSSDMNLKTDIVDVSETEKLVAQKLRTLVKRFKYNSAVEEKGFVNARYHFGVIAQEVKDAFTEFGLDWEEYGVICYEETTEENGNVVQTYSIRYEELLAFIISSL